MLGKGPTFSRRGEFPLDDYNLIGLNNVGRRAEGRRRPHHRHRRRRQDRRRACRRTAASCSCRATRTSTSGQASAGSRTSSTSCRCCASSTSRAGWSGTTPRPAAPVGDSPMIGVRYFSSEAAMDILGEMGVKVVRTLGIDGGTEYADELRGDRPRWGTASRASTPSSGRSRRSSRAREPLEAVGVGGSAVDAQRPHDLGAHLPEDVHGGTTGTAGELWLDGGHTRRWRRWRWALGPGGGLDRRAVGADRGDLDAVAGDVHAQVVVARARTSSPPRRRSGSARAARIQRRAAAAGDEVADAVVLGARVDVVVAGEHRAHAVLLEQRRPPLAQVALRRRAARSRTAGGASRRRCGGSPGPGAPRSARARSTTV